MNIEINGSLYESIQDYCEQNDISEENFNEPVKIMENVKYCGYMFLDCKSFNQSIIIPDSVTNCDAMFMNCKSFNQPIIIPESVINCNEMFIFCSSFNQPIIIPESVKTCQNIFKGCTNFNSPITLKNTIDKCFCGLSIFYDNIVTTPMSNLYGFTRIIKFKYKKNIIEIKTRILKDYNIDKVISFNPDDKYIKINEEDFAIISLMKTLS